MAEMLELDGHDVDFNAPMSVEAQDDEDFRDMDQLSVETDR